RRAPGAGRWSQALRRRASHLQPSRSGNPGHAEEAQRLPRRPRGADGSALRPRLRRGTPATGGYRWGMRKSLMLAPLAALGAVAARDLVQKDHAILRNYPVLGRARFLLEAIGPELRQYIVAGNDEE